MQKLRDIGRGRLSGDEGAKPFDPPKYPPMTTLHSLRDIPDDSLIMSRVDKAGYLAQIDTRKIGNFYSGDTYVIFCKYKVSSIAHFLYFG
jgi:hypothetical protein